MVMRPPYDAGMAGDPEKLARRTALRARRRALVAARDPEADGRRLADHVLVLLRGLGLGEGAVVTSYESVPGEPPTAPLHALLEAAGIRVLVPVTLPDLDLDWRDAAGPRAPLLGRDAVGLADVVLAPGLGVDTSGTRMGQGGGCYDRALPRRRPGTPVVVLLHPGELLDPDAEPLPRRPHDQRVDAVVTAEGFTDLGLPVRGSPPARG
jgi:5-formyltetrahydrofolate cyclo-ligase